MSIGRSASRRTVAIVLAFALGAAGCVARAPVDDADPGGTLTTVIDAEPVLDPQLASFTRDIEIVNMVFEPLLRFDPKTLRPVPGAAKALPEISADGLTYRITIRDEAKYSDGTPVRAADFAYGLSRLCDPSIKGPYASIGYDVIGCAEWSQLDPKKDAPEKQRAAKEKLSGTGIRATADKELTITLTHPAAYFSSILALWVFAPTRESDIAHGGDTWTEPATYIGNGPFVLSAWKHNERLVFSPNRHYRGPTKLKQWTKLMIVEPAVALNAYRHGEIDVFAFSATAGAGQLLSEIASDGALAKEATRITNVCTNYVGFNASRAPFDDPAVRLAFAKALDRDALVRDVLGGLGSPTLSLIPPGLPGYDQADTVQRFDLAEARRLLASSKYAAALPPIVIPHNLQVFSRIRSEWVRDQWRTNLGVDVTTEQVDGPSLTQRFRKPETVPQVFFLAWCADYPDQQDWLSLLFHSSSQITGRAWMGFADAEFDRLVTAADRERDQARRDDLYQTASRMLSARAVVAFLYNSQGLELRKPWVRGIVDSSLGWRLGLTAGIEQVFVAKPGR